MKKHDVLQALKQNHRNALWIPPLAIVLIGFLLAVAAIFALGFGSADWKPDPVKLALWAGIISLTILIAGLVFLSRRRSVYRTATELDTRLHSKNRLEAAAQHEAETSLIAQAQREESTKFLEAGRPVGVAGLLPALALFALLAALFNLGLATWLASDIAKHGWPADKEIFPEKKTPRAQFAWIKPRSEIKASPLEELPLQAQATSDSGLEKVMLEVSVNGGTRKKSVPVDQLPLHESGNHKIDLSLYMDELEVEPFDIVSYHLTGQRITEQKLPPTISDLQFIQVRPLREDALQLEPKSGIGNECLQLLLQLKLAQLGLLKGNHVLASAELAHSEAPWQKENTRIGNEQDVLAQKIAEAVDFLVQRDAPAQVVDWIKQAGPQMQEAVTLIRKEQNPEASPRQEKALSLIVACEKLFIKALTQGKPGIPKKKPKDPFEDEQKFELTKRFQTPAGVLEEMLKKQTEINEEMEKAAKDPALAAEKTAGMIMKEKEVTDTLAALQPRFSEEIAKSLGAAGDKSKETTSHLEANDHEAGTGTGTETLAHMQKAVAAMRRESEAEAARQMAQTQRELNQASDLAAKAEAGPSQADAAKEAADKLAEAREALKAQAEEQQQTGSAEAAKQLAEMVNKINQEAAGKGLKALAEGSPNKPGDGKDSKPVSEKLTALAREAGKGSLNAQEGDAKAKVVENLTKLQGALARMAANPAAAKNSGISEKEVLEELRSQLQNAETVVQLPDVRELATKTARALRDSTPSTNGTSIVVIYETIRAPLGELIALLKVDSLENSRQVVVKVLTESEVDETYREPVAKYFEELSSGNLDKARGN